MGRPERIAVTVVAELGCGCAKACPFGRERFGHVCINNCVHVARFGRTAAMAPEPVRTHAGTLKYPEIAGAVVERALTGVVPAELTAAPAQLVAPKRRKRLV